MTRDLQRKIAELLPDAERELERAQAKFDESLAAAKRDEAALKTAQRLVETLKQNSEVEPEDGSTLVTGEFRPQPQVSQQPLEQTPPHTLPRGAQRKRVVAAVNDGGRWMSIAEVAEAVGDEKARIGAALWKAASIGLLASSEEGKYAPIEFSQSNEER